MLRSAARRGLQIGRLRSKRLFAGVSREVAAGTLHGVSGAPGRAGFLRAVFVVRGSPQSRIASVAPKAVISTASVAIWNQILPAREDGRMILNLFGKWLECCWSAKR
ncbi:hypothetical protein CO660_03865 [Rhizobium sp. L9]|nr:hypothetical protein CO660_03865 [Rhizobium sp. L9]